MCAGCALAAMAAASGSRSWLAAHRPTWMTDRWLRRATVAIFIVAGLVGTMRLSGSSSAAAPGHSPGPLAGKVVGIDPGHNGHNYADPSFIDHPVWNGREEEDCDTTGTATDGGYTEARFNFDVATYLAADLRSEGARIVLTRHTNHGVGPCVTRRARIIDEARADVALDIHADGGPPSGRGFTVLEPIADGVNDRAIGPSRSFGRTVRDVFEKQTRMPTSSYDGKDGIELRDDLAGLNLTTVPKVLIECGNMRNATDARLLVRPSFQRRAAAAMAAAIESYLERG